MKYCSQIKNNAINIYLLIDMEFTNQDTQDELISITKHLVNIQVGDSPCRAQFLHLLLQLLKFNFTH